MALSMKQGIGMEQTLNPKMIAFYELLQRPVVELNQAIQVELEENPALELTAERLCPACGAVMLTDVCRECGYRPGADETELQKSPSELSNDPTPASKIQNFDDDDLDDPMARLAAPETLTEHLHWAWRLQSTDVDYDLGCSIIGCLTDEGYLEEGLEPLAEGLGVEVADLEKVLLQVQQLDPPGVGARNLQECLRLQLENFVMRENEKNSEKELAALALRMVNKQWHAMTRHAYEEIARKLRVPLERVQEAADFVRHRITPYPGSQFRPEWQTQGNGPARLYPDVTITRKEDGPGYEVIVRESRSLGLRINGIYRKLWDSMRHDPDTYSSKDREHVQQYLTRAREFIDNLNQRRKTLKLIIEAVAEQQGDYLEQNLHAMKPLTRLSVAHQLGLHESTVGRAVSGKFAQIPTGAVIPCEIFFDASLAVKEVMKDVLAQEDPRKPYSDEKIAAILEERGIEIARRTVTKYREALKILPAAQRRRYDF
jgi:RNA polymerase sigma-54 factor